MMGSKCYRCAEKLSDDKYWHMISFKSRSRRDEPWGEPVNHLLCSNCADFMKSALYGSLTDITLLPFNENLCQKCGALEANMRYCSGCAQARTVEHVHRVCGRCGFWWLEAVWAGVRVVE